MSPVLDVIFLPWGTSSANETRASHNTLLPLEITAFGKIMRISQELSIWEYVEDEGASKHFMYKFMPYV